MPAKEPLVHRTHTLNCARTGTATFDALRAFKDTWRDKSPEFVP